MRVWARLGATIEVDEKQFELDPIKAIKEAIILGQFRFDGDSYVPEGSIQGIDNEEINFDL